MTLFFKARKSTLASKDGKKKWFPVLVKVGRPVALVDMAEEVSEKSSLTPGDTLSAVRNLMSVARRHLMNSQSVRFDGFGTFTVIGKAQGTGVDTEEEVNALQFNGLRIRFTPEYTRNKAEGTTRAIFSKIEYAKWGGKSNSDNSGGNGSGNDDDDYVDPNA